MGFFAEVSANTTRPDPPPHKNVIPRATLHKLNNEYNKLILIVDGSR